MRPILIVQENGRHSANREYRECFALGRAFRQLGCDSVVWGLGHDNFNRPLGELASECDALVLLENYDSGWLPDLSSLKLPKFFWCVDAHVQLAPYLAMANRHKFDVVGSSTERYCSDFKPLAGRAIWLPNAYDSFLLRRLPEIEKTVPLGFCGNIANRRSWIDYLKSRWSLRHDEMVIGQDMVRAVNSYQIHWNRNYSDDINYRTFETLGCGTCLVTNATPGLGELLRPDVHCLVYSTREEMDEKIDYCLKHPEQRQAIEAAGCEHVRSRHTFVHRATEILKSMGLNSTVPLNTHPEGACAPVGSAPAESARPASPNARLLLQAGPWCACLVQLSQRGGSSSEDFGGSAIRPGLFEWVVTHFPPGSTMLELGSGQGSTKNFSRFYNLFSVEDKAEFVGKYDSAYIHAPIRNGWYDVDVLKEKLPKKYDLILVDGPTGEGNRWGFFHRLELFDTTVPILFDDIHRAAEREMMHAVAGALKKTARVDPACPDFGVVM